MEKSITKADEWTVEDTIRAKDLWEQYQQDHDLSHRKGDTAGFDPRSGEVWLGKSALDVVNQRAAKGIESAMLFERIGYATYARKKRIHHGDTETRRKAESMRRSTSPAVM